MASDALTAWLGPRRRRIGQLKTVHHAVRVPGPGRKWNTEQLNRALVLAVAAEFQGFARHLHDLAADEFALRAAAGRAALVPVLRGHLTTGRKLDVGNAQPSALGADFGRFGMTLWDELKSHRSRAHRWNHDLVKLNEARNAIAHADEPRLVTLRAEGYPITFHRINRWQATLDALARTMDDVTSRYLAALFATARPW